MDPVSFTSGIISIATLAVQLGDALRKAAEFWETVQDAPSDIRRLSRELRLVANVFHAIQVDYEAGTVPTNSEKMLTEALTLAKEDVDQLSELISDLTRKLSLANGSLGKQWRKVQMALKASKVEKFRNNLQNVKSVIPLLQASTQQSSLTQVNSKLDILTTNISSMTTTSSSPQIPHQSSLEPTRINPVSSKVWRNLPSGVSKSINLYKKNFLLGIYSLRTISTTHRYDDGDSVDDENNLTTTKTFLFEFLIRFTTYWKGFRIMTTNTFDRYTLNVIRRRPAGSKIFQLCEDGDVQAVKRLLDRGEASIYDVDEMGRSLLHKAAKCYNPQLCLMLLDLGADVYVQDDENFLPIFVADTPVSFLAICEAGYDIWSLDNCGSFRYSLAADISIWRYIHEHKPNPSVGVYLTERMRFGLLYLADTEVIDFLLPRLLEELLFLPETFDLTYFWFRMLDDLPQCWLYGLFSCWFFKDHGGLWRRTLLSFEYKLSLIFTQIIKPWTSAPPSMADELAMDNDSAMVNDSTTKIRNWWYIECVKRIIKASYWSIKIAHVALRHWYTLFIESGFDLTLSATNEEYMRKNKLTGHIFDCCKDIYFEIVHEDHYGNLSLSITATTLPEFSHLDPQYLCEAGRPRRDVEGPGRCLSCVPESFIRDGRLSLNVPGQWEEPLYPNSKLVLQIRHSFVESEMSYCQNIRPLSTAVTEADIQRVEDDLQNGTLVGLTTSSWPSKPSNLALFNPVDELMH